jgi:hypothetical protein
VRVEFWRDDEARVSGWDVCLPRRRPIRGGVMALGRGQISHDLAQYVIEAATGYDHGFWGLVSQGATFRTMSKPVTKPGRAIIVRHRAALEDSEHLAGVHLGDWRGGEQTPVTALLSQAARQFQALGPADRLVAEWPSPQGWIERSATRSASA